MLNDDDDSFHRIIMMHRDRVSPPTFLLPPPMPPMVKSSQLVFVSPPVSLRGIPSGRPDSANPPLIWIQHCLEEVTAVIGILF